SLGWKLPRYAIDLFAEYRLLINEIGNKSKPPSLLAALDHFQITHITAQRKDEMRRLASSGTSFTEAEKKAVLEYCETDVRPLPVLLEKLAGGLGERQFAQALCRARFTQSIAVMERNGIPLDVATLRELESKWDNLLLALIAEVDRDYRIYDDTTFKF